MTLEKSYQIARLGGDDFASRVERGLFLWIMFEGHFDEMLAGEAARLARVAGQIADRIANQTEAERDKGPWCCR